MFFFFFDDVEEFLKRSLDSSKEEYYEKEKDLNSVKVDFFLPNGCLKLNYPPNTVIAFVNRLASGTVYRARMAVEQICREYDIRAFYIFCEEIDTRYLPLKRSKTPEDIVHVVSFKELQGMKKRVIEKDDFWADRRERIQAKACESFNTGKNTLFLGAGLSKSMGLPGWDELLMSLLESLKQRKALSINDYSACVNDSGQSPLLKARYLKHFYDELDFSLVSDIRNVLYSHITKKTELLPSVCILIKTGKVESVITYNYDDLLEEALKVEQIPFTPIDRSNRPASGTLPIHHIHGMVARDTDEAYDSNVVLSEEDYHGLYNDAFHWANTEQLHALTQTSSFFIGLSMKDPNLRRLLDMSFAKGTKEAVHFAFLPRNEFKEPTKAETLFYHMGVNIIWYEDVNELPKMVLALKK